MLKRARLYEYQDIYAAAMCESGLKRDIVGFIAKYVATSTHYKQRTRLYEENVAKLQEAEKTILKRKHDSDIARLRNGYRRH